MLPRTMEWLRWHKFIRVRSFKIENGHRSAISKGRQSLLHRHFHQPDHSVDDMRVEILEKIYHSSENPTLLTFNSQKKITVLAALVQENQYLWSL